MNQREDRPNIRSLSPLTAQGPLAGPWPWRFIAIAWVAAGVLGSVAILSPDVMAVQVAASVGFLLALVGGLAAATRARTVLDRMRRQVALFSAAHDSSTAGNLYWLSGDDLEASAPLLADRLRNASDSQFARISRCFTTDRDGDRLLTAVKALRARGKAFSLLLRADDRIFQADGFILGHDPSRAIGSFVWVREAKDFIRRTAEAEHERDRLAEILDRVPFPIWRRDETGALQYCNRSYADGVEADRETVLRDGGVELIPAATPAESRTIAESARTSGKPQSDERHVVVGGQRRLLNIVEVPTSDDGGTVGAACDITNLEALRRELKDHVAAQSELLELLATAIAIFGPDRQLNFFNRSYAILWRLDEEWLNSKPLLEEILEVLRGKRRIPEVVDFPEFKKRLAAFFTELIGSHEELMHLPDETTLRMTVNPHPFGGLLFTWEDVTDELALERRLKTEIDVKAATLDHLYDGVAVFGGDGRLKLSNPVYASLWGLSAEAVSGEPHVSVVTELMRAYFDRDDEWTDYKARVIARLTERRTNFEQLERFDGTVLTWATVPLPDGAALMIYRDLTDSVKVERALRERNEALQEADQLKSECVANVSYELRTPLNTIIGFSQILAEHYYGELNQQQDEYVKGVLESSQHLSLLIGDILDLASIEAGQMVLENARFALRPMLESTLSLSQERVRKKDLAVNFSCPDDVGEIVCDERRIKQIVFNLLNNAIKFTPAGGQVSLAAERKDAEIILTVSDTGVGIPRDKLDRVFDKFRRGGTQGQAGTGLGLALVKAFVDLHGGRVKLDADRRRHPRDLLFAGDAEGVALSGDSISQASSPSGRAMGSPSSSNTRNVVPGLDARADGWRVPPSPPRQIR